MKYHDQLKHPEWQKKRLEVMEYCGFECQLCGDKDTQLNVHHPFYRRGAMIWQYTKEELQCLCEKCHKEAHAIDEKIKKELVFSDQLGFGVDTKREILGILKAINYGPWTYLEDSEEIQGFLDYFKIPKHIEKHFEALILANNGRPSEAIEPYRTSFYDIGRLSECGELSLESVLFISKELTRSRLEAVKSRR